MFERMMSDGLQAVGTDHGPGCEDYKSQGFQQVSNNLSCQSTCWDPQKLSNLDETHASNAACLA